MGGTWICTRDTAGLQTRFTLWFDASSNLVWWGAQGKLFLDPSEICEESSHVKWYAGNDKRRQRPRFTWHKCDQASLKACPVATGARHFGAKHARQGGKIARRDII